MHLDLNSIDKVKEFAALMANVEDNIDLVSGRYIVDAKSLLGIFSLDLSKPVEVKFNGSVNEENLKELFQKFESEPQV